MPPRFWGMSTPTEVQFCYGITIQRPIRHHHTAAAQQDVDLGQRQPVLEPGLDLFMLGGDAFPRRALARWSVRTDLGDHCRDQLVGQLTITTVTVQPAGPRPIDVPANGFAVSPR